MNDWRATFARRLSVLAGIFVAWVGVVEARLVYLHVVQHGALLERAEEQQQSRQPIPAPRGEITARDGSPARGDRHRLRARGDALADHRSRRDAPRACAGCCTTATPPAAQALAKQLRWSGRGARYVFLRRKLQDDEAAALRALNEPHVRVVAVPQRSYPGGNTASHLIGYTDIDNKGQTGIELSADALLAGRPGLQLVVKSALPGHSRLLTRPLRAPVPGATIETTIDRDLQFMVERELADAVDRHDADGGAVIVMDPLTGEILALANYPTFDLNEYTVATDEQKLNRAAQHIYEPGSTFKSFIAAAALEVLRMPTSRMFDTSAGYISFGPRRIHDMHRYQALSFMDVIVKSSNVGAIKIGQALGSDAVSRYVYRFGFGETLARDIPHQRAGLVDKRLPQFKPSELASVSMGYQIGVTPLQMVAAVGSIANGGELIAPHVVRATIVDGVRTEVPRQVVRRTIPAQIADELTTILEQVVERGTAKRAQHPRLHHRRQDRHRREARERPLLEGPQQRVVRRLRAVAAPARGDPRHPRLAAPRRPHRRRSGGADLPRRRRGDAAPAGRAAHRARSARPAGRAERAGRADAGQPAGDRARADARRVAGAGERAGHPARRPRPVGPRGDARARTAPASSRGCRAAAWSSASGRQAGTVIRPGQSCDLVLVRGVAATDPERGLEP